MALGKSNANTIVTEGPKLYIGCGNFKVIAINPTMEEKKALFPNRPIESEPVYLSEDQNGVKQLRIEFTLESMDIDGLIITQNFFLKNEPMIGNTSGKVEVIDEFGRNVWMTPEQFEQKYVPVWASGNEAVTKNYRKAFKGEVDLTMWVKNMLAIKDPIDFGTKQYIADTSEAECRFDNIADWFNGDLSELKVNAWGLQKNAVFTAMVGVRSTDKGTFMSVYKKNYSYSYTPKKSEYLMKRILKDKEANMLQDTVFVNDFIKEYTIKPTNLDNKPEAKDVAVEVMPTSDDDLPF